MIAIIIVIVIVIGVEVSIPAKQLQSDLVHYFSVQLSATEIFLITIGIGAGTETDITVHTVIMTEVGVNIE
jgi:hypothetical protein